MTGEDAVVAAEGEPTVEVYAELSIETALCEVQFRGGEVGETGEGVVAGDIVLLG
jgi:hypothetical protein